MDKTQEAEGFLGGASGPGAGNTMSTCNMSAVNSSNGCTNGPTTASYLNSESSGRHGGTQPIFKKTPSFSLILIKIRFCFRIFPKKKFL